MEGLAIATQYLISTRRISFTDLPARSGLIRLFVAVSFIGLAVGALQFAASDCSGCTAQDAHIGYPR